MNMKTGDKSDADIPYPFIRQNLLRDEILIYVTRPHWIIFGPGIVAFILMLWIYYDGAAYLSLRISFFAGYSLYQIAISVVLLVSIYWLVTAIIRYHTSEYGITNKRVLMKTGWIRRNTAEIFLRRLEAINVNQTVPGRIFNYGMIVLVGTGGTEDYYGYIPDPLVFRKRVQQQVDLLIDEVNERKGE